MAGLNIPKRSELPHGTFLGDVNKARLDAQGKLSDYAERASGVAGDMLFGEDTGEGILKDLAYGLVPGGSLFQRATTGTRPGLLDFADFVPGGGVAKAMLPIAAKPTLDALKAGQRMGKTARNVEKVQNPTVKLFHKTDIQNVPSIMKTGIRATSGKEAVHSFDEDDLLPKVWASRFPTDKAVMSEKQERYPVTIGTIQIEMPRDEFLQRGKYKDNRWHGTNDPRDFIPYTGDDLRHAVIFDSEIPPENLTDITSQFLDKQFRESDLRGLHYKLRDESGKPYGDSDGAFEVEESLRSVPASERLRHIRSGDVKSWGYGELPVLTRAKHYYGGFTPNYRPSTQMKKGAIYDKFYSVPTEDHPDLMRKLYYEGSPAEKKDLTNYLRRDYENDWIADEDWFDYDDEARREFRNFIKELESGEQYKYYFPLNPFAD